MLDELRHRAKLLLTKRTSGNNYTFSTVSHRRRLIDKAIKIVLREFGLDDQK